MTTMSSVFVDTSRFVMAKAVATSAADLTLNTLMTNYDKELNEYFGLIASCQDMESFKKETKDFFKRCITSAGVDDSNAENVANKLMGLAQGDVSYNDLLQLALVSEGESLVTEVEGGDLSNAALIKTQIVEFMKYRAPINAVAEFIDYLKKASQTVEDADEIADMTEKKTEFYEEETDLMKLLLDLRNLLIQYDAFNASESLTKTIEDTKKKLGEGEGTYKSRYQVIHKKIVFDLYNTKNITATSLSTINTSAEGNVQKSTKKVWKLVDEEKQVKDPETGEIKTVVEQVYKEVEEEYIDVEKAVKKFFLEMTDYKIAEENFVNSAKDKNFISSKENLTQTYTDSTKNDIYAVQYLAKSLVPLKNTGHPESFRVAANNLVNAKADLDATYAAAKNLSEPEKSEILSPFVTITYHNGDCNASVKTHADNVSEYYGFTSSYFKLYNDYVNRINGISGQATNAERDSLSIAGKGVVGCTARTATNNEIIAIYNDINKARTRFVNAKTKAEAIISKVEAIEKAYEEYNKAFNAWDTAANVSELDGYESDEDIVNVDRNEINNKKQGSYTDQDSTTQMLAKIKQEDINALKTRFNNIKMLMGDAIEAIDDCTYNGTSICQIESLETAIYVAAINQSSFKHADLEAVAFNFATPTLLPVVGPENSPVIYDGQLKLRDDIYEYFKKYILEDDDEGSDSSEGETAKNKIEEMGEKAADNADDSGQLGNNAKELKDSPSRPSKEGSTVTSQSKARAEGKKDIDNASSFASDLFGSFTSTVSTMAVNFRDDLLISDYIMSMFSYDTFENEGKLNYALEKGGYSLSSVSAWNDKKSSYDETFKDTKKTFIYNKTLRNNMINNDTCYSYGNEIEYILYGGSNKANKASAYASIYLLRYVFDLPAVFKAYWNHGVTVSIATAVQGASLGIIPIPLTKLVICLALTAIEAALDMNAIRSGLGVPLVKLQENLFCSLPDPKSFDKSSMKLEYGEDSDAENTDKIGTGGLYFRYGDYLRFFLIFGLMSSEKEKSICLRTADVIQANMRTIGGKDSKFLLSKSQVYYKIDAEVSFEPLMLKIPFNSGIIGDTLDEISEWNQMDVTMVRGY